MRCPSPANPGGLYFECVGQPIDYIEETLSKDWGGFRTELSTLGITPTASYTTQLMGNPSGGQSQGFTYAGTLEASINWDLDRLLGIPGLSFNIGGAWSTGRNLSADHIGNKATVQSAYTAPGNGTNNLTLGEIYLQQQLFNNSLVIAAGRLAPQSTFATMPVFNSYLNAAINPAPGALLINDVTFASYPPGVEWGAQALYNVTPALQVAAGVFNTNRSSALGGKGGLNFAFQQGNRGALSVLQLNYLFNHAPGDTGLPGQYSFGGFYDSNKFTNLSNPNSTKSGLYMHLRHVSADGLPRRRGRQPERPNGLGTDRSRTEINCKHPALFRRCRPELSGLNSRPRGRHCGSGGDLRDLQPVHSPHNGRNGD